MIEEDGNAAWRDKYGNPIANDQCEWRIDLEAPSAVQFDGEELKGFLLLQNAERLIEILGSHGQPQLRCD
jgi:hypothetical protein